MKTHCVYKLLCPRCMATYIHRWVTSSSRYENIQVLVDMNTELLQNYYKVGQPTHSSAADEYKVRFRLRLLNAYKSS